MTRIIRHIAGYLIGFTVFVILIPAGFFQLSRLDYLVGYQMIIPSMVMRFAVAGFIMLIAIIFALWSNLWLLLKGKGGPVDAFGMAISPRTQNLVMNGPYRFTRNPMVFGAMMMYLSVVLYLNSIFGLIGWFLFLFLIVVFIRKTEEKRLIRDFGNDYLAYRKKVAMIVPFISFRH